MQQRGSKKKEDTFKRTYLSREIQVQSLEVFFAGFIEEKL